MKFLKTIFIISIILLWIFVMPFSLIAEKNSIEKYTQITQQQDNGDGGDDGDNGDGGNDDPFGDPFEQNNGDGGDDDPFGDPFNNDGNNDDTNGKDNSSGGFSFEVPKPDLQIKGTVGLGISIIFQGDNEYLEDSDLARVRYLASDVYGNFQVNYDFNNFHILGNFDVLVTLDSSGMPDFNFDVRELYFDYYSKIFEINFGHIFVKWSQMQVYTIANYFNPMSLSNIYSMELSQAINGIQAIFYVPFDNNKYINYMNFELVVVPLFTEMSVSTSLLSPLTNSISATEQTLLDEIDDTDGENNINTVNIVEDDTQLPPITTVDLETTPPSYDILNTQFGFKYSINFPGVDLSLIYFHGFYNKFMFSYTNTKTASGDIGDPSDDILTGADDYGYLIKGARDLNIKRVYRIIDSIALNSSFTISSATFTLETAFTFNTPLIYKRKVFIPSTGIFFDKALTTAPTFQFAVGVNWEFISDFRLMLEYSEFFVLKELDLDKESLPGNTIFGGLVYMLTTNKIEMTFLLGANFDYLDKQFVALGYVNADFLNGLSMQVAGAFLNDFGDIIDGEDRPEGMFGPLNKSFILAIMIFYEF